MKKTLAVLSLSALAAISAHAQTVINIGGSTAGRTAVHNNLVAILSGLTYAYDGTSGSPARATRAIYHGTYDGKAYIIRTYWAGSVNGITPVVQATPQTNFIATSVVGTAAGQFIASPTLGPAAAQQIGYSDIFASTVNATPTDVEDEVGVISFQWYANKGSANIDNITPGLVRYLYSSSEGILSQFTGNPAHSGTIVYPIGRNADSGTRGTAMAESGYGNVAAVDQYTANVSGGAVTGLNYTGNAGFSSGSNVKGVMDATYSGGVLIGYLGSADFTANAVPLKWNGVPYSVAAIQNGQYSFWGYLHMNRMNTLTGDALDFYDALRDAISAEPLDAGVLKINDMNVQRDADGAPIYPL